MAMKDTEHQDALELLPWYLNGTLTDEEANRVRNCFANSSELASEADDTDTLLKALGDDVPVPMLNHERIERVMARLDEQPQHSNPFSKLIAGFRDRLRRSRSHRQARGSFGLGSPIPMALAAAFALVAVILIVPQPDTVEGQYGTLTGDPTPVVPVQVELEEGVSNADAQALFEELSLDGERQPDGTYRIELPEETSVGELYQILQILRADGRVAEAQALTDED